MQNTENSFVHFLGENEAIETLLDVFLQPITGFSGAVMRNINKSDIEFSFHKELTKAESIIKQNIATKSHKAIELAFVSILQHQYSARDILNSFKDFISIAYSPDESLHQAEFECLRTIFECVIRNQKCDTAIKLKILQKSMERFSTIQKQLMVIIGSYNILNEKKRKGAELSRYAFKFLGENIGLIYEKSIRHASDLISLLEGKQNPHILKSNMDIIAKFCRQNALSIGDFRFREMRIIKNASSHGQFELDHRTEMAKIFNIAGDGSEDFITKSPNEMMEIANWLMNYLYQDLEFSKLIQREIFSDRKFKNALLKAMIKSYKEFPPNAVLNFNDKANGFDQICTQ